MIQKYYPSHHSGLYHRQEQKTQWLPCSERTAKSTKATSYTLSKGIRNSYYGKVTRTYGIAI